MTVETISLNRSHGGMQGVYKHASRETGTEMTAYVPPHERGAKLPVVWYLSGLTCTHANVTEKGRVSQDLRRVRFDLCRTRQQPTRPRRTRRSRWRG